MSILVMRLFAITKRKRRLSNLPKTIYIAEFAKRPRLWGLAEDLGSKRDLDEVVILCLPARLLQDIVAGVLAVHPRTLWS